MIWIFWETVYYWFSWTIKLSALLCSFYENVKDIFINIKTCLTHICISIYEIHLKHEHTHVVTDKYGKAQFRRRKQHF